MMSIFGISEKRVKKFVQCVNMHTKIRAFSNLGGYMYKTLCIATLSERSLKCFQTLRSTSLRSPCVAQAEFSRAKNFTFAFSSVWGKYRRYSFWRFRYGISLFFFSYQQVSVLSNLYNIYNKLQTLMIFSYFTKNIFISAITDLIIWAIQGNWFDKLYNKASRFARGNL